MEHNPVTLEMVRAILQNPTVTTTSRTVALLAASILFLGVTELVRRRKLLEEFTPIWMTCAGAILALAISLDLMMWLTNLIGAWSPSSTVFFFGLIFLMAISLDYSVRLSSLSGQAKVLSQELALMQMERDEARAARE